MSTPGNRRVLEKYVCYNERSAAVRGRKWKRRHPENIVRIFSLLPGDTSPAIEIRYVPLGRKRKNAR